MAVATDFFTHNPYLVLASGTPSTGPEAAFAEALRAAGEARGAYFSSTSEAQGDECEVATRDADETAYIASMQAAIAACNARIAELTWETQAQQAQIVHMASEKNARVANARERWKAANAARDALTVQVSVLNVLCHNLEVELGAARVRAAQRRTRCKVYAACAQ